MAIYKLKRKNFGGVGDAAGHIATGTVGGVMEGTGTAVKKTGKLAKTIGTIGGTALGSVGWLAGPIPGLVGMGLGAGLTAAAGSAVNAVASGVGEGLEDAGRDIRQ